MGTSIFVDNKGWPVGYDVGITVSALGAKVGGVNGFPTILS